MVKRNRQPEERSFLFPAFLVRLHVSTDFLEDVVVSRAGNCITAGNEFAVGAVWETPQLGGKGRLHGLKGSRMSLFFGKI